jgi:hypothetical protein
MIVMPFLINGRGNSTGVFELRFLSHTVQITEVRNPMLLGRYEVTQWSIVLLEKLVVAQLVKKFPTFHGTPNVITVFRRLPYWSVF